MGYLVPDTLELGSAEDGCANTHVVKSKPAMFDATKLSVQQYFATSKDGCRIPYFVIGNTNLIPDGSNPVLLNNAYGGFEISMTCRCWRWVVRTGWCKSYCQHSWRGRIWPSMASGRLERKAV